jgi:hypothetical protein
VYPCIGQRNHLFCKTNTQKMVAKVNNLCTEEKPSFVYLPIRVSGQRNHSLRLCPQAQLFSPKKHENNPFLPKKRYLWRSGWRSTEKKHSFTHSFFPTTQISPLHVGCLVGCRIGCCVVVMLLSLSLFTLLPHCQHCRCRHRWHTATAATAVGWHGG